MVVSGSLEPPECPSSVLKLIERFDRHRDAYKRATYNEAQVRDEFINPFFEALGWDIHNKEGYAEAYKDVIHEAALKFGTSTKAPDYCFRIGGVRKFFVEAKKPAENLKQKPEHAYQLRRYAWTAKLPISILTDFEEFAVFDCTKKPKPTDKASTGRVLYVAYDDYADRWSDIWSRFSKDAILKGEFFRYFTQYIARLPIRRLDMTTATDKATHDRMVELVGRMLTLQKQLEAAKTPTDKTAIQRQIDATDRQIDHLVYELYGLTDDEIRIVEEASGKRVQ